MISETTRSGSPVSLPPVIFSISDDVNINCYVLNTNL
jgi:hypothetical protein